MKGRKVHNRLGTTTKPAPNKFSMPHKRDQNQTLRRCPCGKDVKVISPIDHDPDLVQKEVLCVNCYNKSR